MSEPRFPSPSGTRRGRRLVVLLAALALAASACSSDTRIGTELDKNLFEKSGGTLSAPTPTAKAEPRKTTRAKPTKTAVASPRQTRRDTFFRVRIMGGQCGIGVCGFKPEVFVVSLGTIVIVKNEDSRPRTWTADDGSFDSGEIPPGKTWKFKTTKRGRFPVHDETVTYIHGEMQVR